MVLKKKWQDSLFIFAFWCRSVRNISGVTVRAGCLPASASARGKVVL